MKNIFIVTAIITAMLTTVNAQTVGGSQQIPNQGTNQNYKKQNSSFDQSRLIFGGGIGMGFGSNDFWSINVSPQVGYRFSNRFIAGAGISYSHSGEEWGDYKYSQNYAGFNVYGEYYPIDWLVFRVKPEILYKWETAKAKTPSGTKKYTDDGAVPAVVVGGGLYLKPMSITLNYDLVQDDSTPYGDNVFLSIGFYF